MSELSNLSCLLCGGHSVPVVRYVGQTTCPECGAVYEYDEGIALRAIPEAIQELIKRHLDRGAD